jgi:hypothetical protein
MKERKMCGITTLLSLLRQGGFEATAKQARQLSSTEWNLVYEWIYYKVNTSEKDYRKDRKVPQPIGTLFLLKNRRSWGEIFGK